MAIFRAGQNAGQGWVLHSADHTSSPEGPISHVDGHQLVESALQNERVGSRVAMTEILMILGTLDPQFIQFIENSRHWSRNWSEAVKEKQRWDDGRRYCEQ